LTPALPLPYPRRGWCTRRPPLQLWPPAAGGGAIARLRSDGATDRL